MEAIGGTAKDKGKNIYSLGLVAKMFDLNVPKLEKLIGERFTGKDPSILNNALAAFHAGYQHPLDGVYETFRFADFKRRTDGSLVGRRQIPRLKLEYQATRSIFGRVIAEYDAPYQDTLRDDSRTERPIFLRDASTGSFAPALGSRRNGLRLDALFAWQPTPGTVFFAGYGSSLNEAEAFAFRDLSRSRDGFFMKFSYLFRL